jgi:hypothetical protein
MLPQCQVDMDPQPSPRAKSQEHAGFTVHEPHMLRLLFLHMLSTRYDTGVTSVGSVRSRIVPNHTQSYRIINTTSGCSLVSIG